MATYTIFAGVNGASKTKKFLYSNELRKAI